MRIITERYYNIIPGVRNIDHYDARYAYANVYDSPDKNSNIIILDFCFHVVYVIVKPENSTIP